MSTWTRSQQGQVQLQGALTSVALQERQVAAAEAEKEHRQEEQLQQQIRQQADTAGGRLAREHATAWYVLHQKKQEMAKREREAADKQVQDLQDKERFARRGPPKDILACEQRITDLEALAAAQAEGLKPIKDHAQVQGSLLRTALFLEETRLTELLQNLTTKQKVRNDRRITLGRARDDADRKERALTQEQSSLNGAETRRTQRLEVFVREGLIESVEKQASDAVVRWGYAAAQQSATARVTALRVGNSVRLPSACAVNPGTRPNVRRSWRRRYAGCRNSSQPESTRGSFCRSIRQ